jgi:hypothetical protein
VRDTLGSTVRSINSYKFHLHLINELQFHRDAPTVSKRSCQKTGPAITTCVVPQNGIGRDIVTTSCAVYEEKEKEKMV